MGVSGQPFFTAALHHRPGLNALKTLQISALCRESYHDLRLRRQPALSLSQGRRTYGTRPQMARKRFPWHAAFNAVPIIFIYFIQKVPLCCGIYVFINISDRVQIVHELPFLSNNTSSETLLHKSGAVRSGDWIFIIGAPA
jgi:hypothetical protein